MAVWMATSQKDLISKAAAVFFPISGFVAMGLDHSVANMFLIPFGIFCGAEITWADMVMKNLVPVTLGKEAFYAQMEMGLDDAYAYASRVMTQNMLARDADEGIAAVLEKRAPRWDDR